MDIHKKYSSVAVIEEQGVLVDHRPVSHRYREELTGYYTETLKDWTHQRCRG
jgi:hypothetical protein